MTFIINKACKKIKEPGRNILYSVQKVIRRATKQYWKSRLKQCKNILINESEIEYKMEAAQIVVSEELDE